MARTSKPCAARCATSARPMNPSAPVTATRATSDPAPAMFAVETEAALDEPADVARALACGTSPVMDDLHRRHVGGTRDAVQAHRPVEVFEIEEELRVEAAAGVDRLAPHQQHRAGHRGNVDHLAV